MEEKVVYVANDGVTFEKESDCLYHEELIAFDSIRDVAISNMVLYDKNKNEININNANWDDFEYAYVSSEYLEILETFSEDVYRVFYDKLSIHIPNDVGVYFWDDEEDEWFPY